MIKKPRVIQPSVPLTEVRRFWGINSTNPYFQLFSYIQKDFCNKKWVNLSYISSFCLWEIQACSIITLFDLKRACGLAEHCQTERENMIDRKWKVVNLCKFILIVNLIIILYDVQNGWYEQSIRHSFFQQYILQTRTFKNYLLKKYSVLKNRFADFLQTLCESCMTESCCRNSQGVCRNGERECLAFSWKTNRDSVSWWKCHNAKINTY